VLVVRDRLVSLAAGGGELAQPERRGRADQAAHPHQGGELAGVPRGAAEVAQRETSEQPGQRETGARQVVEIDVAARLVDRLEGVGNAALRQCVAGLRGHTGGIVRCRIEHA